MILNKLGFLNKKSEESQILFIYRFISLIITSTFYFSRNQEHQIGKKIFIIGCISISAVIVSYLYLKFEDSNKNIMILLLIETVGNSILLIPSGGISSPFIWYSLNTIFISAIFLKSIFCWINFFIYFLNYYILSFVFAKDNLNILNLIKDEPNLLLSFIMIIGAIHGWAILIKNIRDKNRILEEVNSQLESANQQIIQSMDHINSLYQTVNILTIQGNKEGLINVLFEHIRSITKSDILFYYDISENSNRVTLDGNGELLESLEESIWQDLDKILQTKEGKEIEISGCKFILMKIQISHRVYGILGIGLARAEESIIYKNTLHELKFLSELISVAFEKLVFEEINNRLVITEEQNRIANEIHDSVLQRLFSMSCGVFTLIKRLDKCSRDEIERELNFFRKTTDSAMKDLREKIYGLSWKKSGYNSFSRDIKEYIDSINKMNKVNIPFIISGSDELLSYEQKKALYRMICEGVGNSFRHGNAKNIEVNLKIDSSKTILNIIDDGIGFDLMKIKNEKTKGMGLENLYQLTKLLHGEIEIDTSIGMGCSISVVLPNNVHTMKGVEVI